MIRAFGLVARVEAVYIREDTIRDGARVPPPPYCPPGDTVPAPSNPAVGRQCSLNLGASPSRKLSSGVVLSRPAALTTPGAC